MGEKRLALHIPAFEELGYRQRIMADPDTMSYNAGYDPYPGYDRATGCIAFPENEWRGWYEYFIGQEPERFYAYILRLSDGAFIGEVNVHKCSGADYYDMGIVIEARYRGLGYSHEALGLLLAHAFEGMGVNAVHNDFEVSRKAAVLTHLACGFREYRRENGMLELLITREQWLGAK